MNELTKLASTALIGTCLSLFLSAGLSSIKIQHVRSHNQLTLNEKYLPAQKISVIPKLRNAANSTAVILSPNDSVRGAAEVLKRKAGQKLLALTAYHVVRDLHPEVVNLGLLDTQEVVPMRVIKYDEDLDIALLIGLDEELLDGPETALAKGEPELGETIWVIGHPRGIVGNITKGVLGNILDFGEGFRVLRIDAAVYYGNSGGGMYNDKGELVGLVCAMEVQPTSPFTQDLVPGGGIALSIKTIRTFLKGQQ